MYNPPTENITLTIEQLTNRVGNLQREVAQEIENLTVVRNDCERVTKEKEYQQELLTDISSRLETSKEEFAMLQTELQEAKNEFNSILTKGKVVESQNQEKSQALSDREDKLSLAEEEYNLRVKDLNTAQSALALEKLTVEKAKEAFVNAANTVSWK